MAFEQAANSLCHRGLHGTRIGDQSPTCENKRPSDIKFQSMVLRGSCYLHDPCGLLPVDCLQIVSDFPQA